ncbi:1-phosphatidylinositol 4,5-bisphosphate phosphodiesterase eta-1 isoform X3 [Clupea harengus]|uniref:Phosphoinositide phospholipase C n=1 Tax=Clupea harengus TaxID=7950 RepID=A0A6P8FSQ9_CLUHA|nr:1-phosphatidylinositol 4,5-bisphosphate phosphodiesterase eta-1 isoform X3 [Clupea harengus]
MAELEVFKNISLEKVERCMSVMQSGTQMVKLKNGSKGLVRLFYLDEHRSCIRWRPSRKSEKAKITIDSLYKVTEGRQSDIFHRHAEGSFDPACCFTIYHGNHMESVDLVTANAEEARTWVTGLRYLMAGISDEDSLAKRQRTHDQWMKQTFEEADKNGDGLLNIDEIYQLLHKMNVNLPRRKVKQMFQEADTDDQQGTLTFEEFSVFYKMMSLRRDLYLLLMCYSEKKDHLTAEELGNFLRVEQKMPNVTVECCLDIIDKFENSEENKQKGILGIEGFTSFMRSPTCDIFNPMHLEVNQDMDQSLCNYFISSSHNTYLTGDQLLSHSKTDMYAWVLQAGCRCVEVDCWDGPDGEPMVQHGYTLTSKITFKSVVETIDKYAFINNEYPVILSIENHCSIQQQKKIAQHLREIFGDKLDVEEAFSKDPKQLPSPNSLRGKILIKGKRLPTHLSADAEEGEVSDDDSADEIEDDFKLRNSSSNSIIQRQVESHIRKKLDSLQKESQIGDKEDTDSFSIGALLRATHEGLHRNLKKNSKETLKKSQSRSFIGNLKHKRNSKSRMKCQSVDVDTDDEENEEVYGKELVGVPYRGGRRRRTIKLSRDLSTLVGLTNTLAAQQALDEGAPGNVLSFSETRAQQLVHHRAEEFLRLNHQQLSRIYPSAYRIDSSNFNPQAYWNVGCQLVALNYQTEGRMMQLNRAKFMVNGGSGYVLKPPPMCKGSFSPFSNDPLPAYPKKQLLLKIISGQQLPKPPDSMMGDRGEIIDPFVEVEIIGLPVDCCKEQTRVVDDNGFNPVWEETLSFTLHMPEMALVRFLVWDHDPIGRDFVGQRTVAFSSLMPGYRHVYLDGLTEASIFVHITVHDVYGKWSPLVLNPSYTIMHFLGANKNRQLKGIRGLFNKGSKASVENGLPMRKRSLSDHLLRRTASAPAKGRRKTKMALAEAAEDRKNSTGEALQAQEVALDRRTSPRAPLQHRPVSMPLEKLLQGQLSLASPDQGKPDPITDTLIDLVHFARPRSISVDLLIETTPSYNSDDHSSSVGKIPGADEMSNTAYLVIGEGEKNVDDPNTAPSSLDRVSHKPNAKEVPTPCCSSPAPGSSSASQVSSPVHHKTSLSSPSPLAVDQYDQQSQLSLQDSTISRLIDAVSLGNEYDTCGSISALIGQFELTMEHGTPKTESGQSIYGPSLYSVTPNSHRISHKHNKSNTIKTTDASSSPLKAIPNSQKHASPKKVLRNTSSPSTVPFYSEPLLLSSPETTEPAVYTILDEEVLSPVSLSNQRDESFGVEKNFRKNAHGCTLDSFPSKQEIGVNLEDTDCWGENREDGQRGQYTTKRSVHAWQANGYTTSASTGPNPDHFVFCHESAGSSLMEVELNVDEDPLETTQFSPRHGYGWNGRGLNNTISAGIHNAHYTSSLHDRLSNEPSPLHQPTLQPPPSHRHAGQPFQLDQRQSFSNLCQDRYQISNARTDPNHHNINDRTLSGRHWRDTYSGYTTNGRQGMPQKTDDHDERAGHFHNGNLSEYLSEPQRHNSTMGRDLYSPISDCDVPYNYTENGFVSTKYSQHTQAAPPHMEHSLAAPGVTKGPSPCKSKSLGDLTSDDISCNFQSKYQVISRSFITSSRDNRRMASLNQRPQSADPLTEQLRKLVTLEQEELPQSSLSNQIPPKPLPTSLPSLNPFPVSSAEAADDLEDPPPLLTRRLSSRSQSRVRHIASRAREKQEALKSRTAANSNRVVLRHKSPSSQNPLPNRHSTGSYIAGYLEQLEDRGLPEGACTSLRYSYGDHYYTDDSALLSDSCLPSEPEVYFLLRL